jgi:hypothetical protein
MDFLMSCLQTEGMDTNTALIWKKCSTCKNPILLGKKYFVCSVSTCTGQRTGYSFCSITCFEAHLPGARHRDAGAIEKTAPLKADPISPGEAQPAGADQRRRIIPANQPGAGVAIANNSAADLPHDVLIVASKLKDYIRARSEMNTSASVFDILSDIVRIECDRAIDNARREGRKTVLDRDFKK